MSEESGLGREVVDSKKERLSLFSQLSYDSELVAQAGNVVDDPKKFNEYLLSKLVDEKGGLKTAETFGYICANLEKFKGVGIWPEGGEVPVAIDRLVHDCVSSNSKYEAAEVVEVIKDVFSLSEDQERQVIFEVYTDYCAGYSSGESRVFESMKKNFPLDENRRLAVAKRFLINRINRLSDNYSEVKTQDYYQDANSHLYDIKKMQTDTHFAKKNLSVDADLFNDPEVVTEGWQLLKVMLNSEINVSTQLSQVSRLYEVAPSFFQGDYFDEGRVLWNKVVKYGSFSSPEQAYNDNDKRVLKVLDLLGFDSTKKKDLFKHALIGGLCDSQVLEGLIEKYIKGTEYSDLLLDDEVISAAMIGRRKALSDLHMHNFSKVSEMFGFSNDWTANAEDVALVKESVLDMIQNHYSVHELSRVAEVFGDPVIIDDSEIRLVIAGKTLEDPDKGTGWSYWEDTKKMFVVWKLPIEGLRERAKAFVMAELSEMEEKDFSLTMAEKCIGAFPELLDLPEIHDLASDKVLSWVYEKSPYAYGYFGLGDTIRHIRDTIELYKLRPELLDEWKTNFVGAELSRVKDFEQVQEFRKLLERIDLSPERLSGLVRRSYLDALSNGDLIRIDFLAKNLAVDVKDIEGDELAKAGELGMIKVLDRGEFHEAILIQKTCHLPPEFFERDEMIQKLGQFLAGEYLCSGEFDELQKMVGVFGLSAKSLEVVDKMAINKVQEYGNLIRFVSHLGGGDIADLYPNTFKHVGDLITNRLSEDLDLADYFVENLGKFHHKPWVLKNLGKAVQHYSVAIKLVNLIENDSSDLWKNDAWVAEILEKAKAIIEEKKQKNLQANDGEQSEGFMGSDPYKEHPWLFNSNQTRLTFALIEFSEGGDMEGMNDDEREVMRGLLKEVDSEVTTSYKKFLDDVRGNINKWGEDGREILDSDSGISKVTLPLLRNVRSFIIRYLVQEYGGNIEEIRTKLGSKKWLEDKYKDEDYEIRGWTNRNGLLIAIQAMLGEGFDRYKKIIEIDIPLYDKLYTEFDSLRDLGDYPLEVYLGRDGIYAWIGRRAQDVARRRKMGFKERLRFKEMGEVIAIQPKYVVYPRYFRDNLSYDTKRKFLEQEGIGQNFDPMFFDTGYTGTIPEQIMKIMGFEPEDIDRRIRLLSAPHAGRRVKGVSENARGDIVEYIEHNSKIEESAEGLVVDDKTGKIRRVAKPTSPTEQFYFMMVNQAIARHYWLQEQRHHVPQPFVGFDTENYLAYVDRNFVELFPEGNIHDDLENITGGGGDHDNGETFLFDLRNGSKVVCRRVVGSTGREIREEYINICDAKKAGIKVPDPVGVAISKEKNGVSYIMTGEVDGYPGEVFVKKLRDTGKYSDDQIDALSKQVSIKIGEIESMFRDRLSRSKSWEIGDVVVEFDEDTGKIGDVIPYNLRGLRAFDSGGDSVDDDD